MTGAVTQDGAHVVRSALGYLRDAPLGLAAVKVVVDFGRLSRRTRSYARMILAPLRGAST